MSQTEIKPAGQNEFDQTSAVDLYYEAPEIVEKPQPRETQEKPAAPKAFVGPPRQPLKIEEYLTPDAVRNSLSGADWWDALDASAEGKPAESFPEGSAVRLALESAKQTPSKNVLSARREAARLGLPFGVVLGDPEQARLESIARQIEENRLFAAFAEQNSANAAVARDNVDILGNMFKTLSDFAANPSLKGVGDVLSIPSKALQDWMWKEGSHANDAWKAINLLGNAEVALVGGAKDTVQALASLARMGSEQIAGQDNQFALRMEKITESLSQVLPRPEFQSFLGGLGYDAVRAMPPMLASIATTYLTRNPELGLAVMGAYIAGSDYEKFRKMTGADRAAFASLFDAVLQAPLESISLGKFMKLMGSRGAGNILKAAGVSSATEGITEAAQSFPEWWADMIARAEKEGGGTAWGEIQWVMKQFSLPEVARKVFGDALYEGLVGALMGAFSGGIPVALQMNDAKNFAEQHSLLHDHIEEAKQGIPGLDWHSMHDMLAQVRSINQDVYVSAGDLLKIERSSVPVLDTLGIDMDAALKAEAEGGGYKLNMSTLHAKLDKAQFDSVMRVVREDPLSLSYEDATDGAGRVLQENVARATEAYKMQAEQETEFRAELERLRAEAKAAIEKTPSLQAQVDTIGQGVDDYVDTWLRVLEAGARRLASFTESGDATEILRKLAVTGKKAYEGPINPAPQLTPEETTPAPQPPAPVTPAPAQPVAQSPAAEAAVAETTEAAQTAAENPAETAGEGETAQDGEPSYVDNDVSYVENAEGAGESPAPVSGVTEGEEVTAPPEAVVEDTKAEAVENDPEAMSTPEPAPELGPAQEADAAATAGKPAAQMTEWERRKEMMHALAAAYDWDTMKKMPLSKLEKLYAEYMAQKEKPEGQTETADDWLHNHVVVAHTPFYGPKAEEEKPKPVPYDMTAYPHDKLNGLPVMDAGTVIVTSKGHLSDPFPDLAKFSSNSLAYNEIWKWLKDTARLDAAPASPVETLALSDDPADFTKENVEALERAIAYGEGCDPLVDDTPTSEAAAPVVEPTARNYGTEDAPNTVAIGEYFAEQFLNGKGYAKITDARKEVAELLGVKKIDGKAPIAKSIDEAIELGVVRAARAIVAEGRKAGTGDVQIYRDLVNLYERQPNLSVRTSTSVAQQAYSTPAPIAFLASRLAGITPQHNVYEPTAGNGMLVMEADPGRVIANELNPERAARLRSQGFLVTEKNAVDYTPSAQVDVVIENPPFGSVWDENHTETLTMQVDDFTTKALDQAIVARSLQALRKDGNGRAVLIIGGQQGKTDKARAKEYRTGAQVAFYRYLFSHYKVLQHIAIDGKLYSRQGASFPIDIIVLDNSGTSEGRKFPGGEPPAMYSSFDELEVLLNEDVSANGHFETDTDGVADSGTEGHAGTDTVPVSMDNADVSGTERPGEYAGGERAGGEGRTEGDEQPSVSNGLSEQPDNGNPADRGEPAVRNAPGGRSADGENNGGTEPGGVSDTVDDGRRRDGSPAVQPARPADDTGAGGNVLEEKPETAAKQKPKQRPHQKNTQYQTPYEPASAQGSMGTLVPKNMADAVRKAFDEVQKEHGNIDAFVAEELGYPVEELGKYFAAEQVDAIALALHNIKKGDGFIIGDQTGIGKGRVNAAIIRWAARQGKTPVFITVKNALYADMVRDLTDIGMEGFTPFVTNAALTGKSAIPLPDGRILKTPSAAKHGETMRQIAKEGLGEYGAVFTTYDQLKGKSPRRDFLSALAPNAVFILDESHNAGGSKNDRAAKNDNGERARPVSAFVRDLLKESPNGVFYSSATYAKNPNVMDLYFKTGMRFAVGDIASLAEAINRGGVPLQQVVAAQLSEAGQYLRRERTWEGADVETVTLEADKKRSDMTSQALRSILEFDRLKNEAVDAANDEAAGAGGSATGLSSAEESAMSTTNFAGLMHNVIAQAMLAQKVDAIVDAADEALKRGEKPVITLANTMGSFIEECAKKDGIKPGQPINLSFKDVYLRYLLKSRTAQEKRKGDGGKVEIVNEWILSDEELGPAAVLAYEQAERIIEESGLDSLPASFIDAVEEKLRARGYRVAEYTGRNVGIDYSGEQPVLRTVDNSNLTHSKVINGFNSGDIDCVILNSSGSTGISMHASEKFADQRRRCMIVAQADLNIDTFMQTLGRVFRTGQVVPPRYQLLFTDIPAEKRPAAVLSKKMASLNANTTAAKDSDASFKDAPDFLNKYGDQIAMRFPLEMPELHRAMGEPISGEAQSSEGAMRKLTGYIPLLSVEDQARAYAFLESEYAALIEQLEATGDLDLEAKVLPLDAKLVSEEMMTPASDDAAAQGSPFAQPVMLGTYDVKSLGKPWPASKVREMVAKGEQNQLDRQALQDAHDDFMKKKLESIKDDKARENTEARIADNFSKFAYVLQNYTPGTVVTVSTREGDIQGIVTEVQRKPKVKTENPLALSAYTVDVAVVSPAKHIVFPFSQLANQSTDLLDEGHTTTVTPDRWGEPESVYRQLDAGQTVTRENAVIATGNLLGAFEALQGNKGRVIMFQDHDGKTISGVLMPKGMKADEVMADADVMLTPEQAIQYLEAVPENGGIVKTRDNNFRVFKTYDGYRIVIESSKAKGAQYFLNRGILEALGRDFVRTSSGYVADELSAEKMRHILDVMAEQGYAFKTDMNKDKAREITGAKAAQPKTELAKVVDEEGAGDVVAHITPESASEMGLPHEGDFVVLESDLAPIEQKHGDQFRSLGFADARAFVNHVMEQVDAVYKGKGADTYVFVRRGERRSGQVVAEFEAQYENGRYRVTTAHPVRNDYFKKKSPLWERAQSDHSASGTPGAVSGQSGVTNNVSKAGQNSNGLFSMQGGRSIIGGLMTYTPETDSYLITLFHGANLSVLLHETAHYFFTEMELMATRADADPKLVSEFNVLRNWLGAEPGEKLNQQQAEQLAESMEEYLREGRSPSRDLADVFGKFRKWLMVIYRRAEDARGQGMNLEITDDVRGVFDRMFAAEEEIAEAFTDMGLDAFIEDMLDKLNITGSQREYLKGLLNGVKDKGAIDLMDKRNKEARLRRKQYMNEARGEVAQDKLTVALADMRKTPLDLDAVREQFGKEMVAEIRKRNPAYLHRNGEDPQVFALSHGYESAEAFLQDVAERGIPRRDAVRNLFNQKMTEYDALHPAEDSLAQTEELQKLLDLVGEYLARNAGNQNILHREFSAAAENKLAEMTMDDAVRPGQYLSAMKSAVLRERRAIARGDFQAALTANFQSRLNLELYRQSRALRDQAARNTRGIKRYVESRKTDPVARYIVMMLAAPHGLSKFIPRLADGKDFNTITEWLKNMEDQGYPIFIDAATLFGGGSTPWRAMTVEAYFDLMTSIKQVIVCERNLNKFLTRQEKETLAETAEAISDTIHANRDSVAVKTVEKDSSLLHTLKSAHAWHAKIESVLVAMDGGQPGVLWNAIYRPITEAEDDQTARLRDVRDNLKRLMGVYTQKELMDMGSKRELVPEINETMSKQERICVALNMGNDINKERVLSGHKWTQAQLDAVLRPLTERDWSFVQSVWDYLETFRDESFRLHEDITGLRPTRVEPVAFDVQTADGKAVHLRGGYYPIRYNPTKSFFAGAQEEKEAAQALFGGTNYLSAQTKQGHLKERSKYGGKKVPLLLDLSVMTDHIFNVVHDLAYRRAVLDVAKIVRNDVVRQAFESTGAAQYYAQLMPWLQDIANERQVPLSSFHKCLNWARSSTTIMQMGLKATTILTQPVGLTQSIEVIGYKWVKDGLMRTYFSGHLADAYRECLQMSEFMRSRMVSYDRDVRDVLRTMNTGVGINGWLQKLRNSSFIPMAWFQMGVDLPTWWGAFDKSMKEQGDARKAAQYADYAVRISQGSGATKDLARVQRGDPLFRTLTMFYSYFNTLYNLGATRIAWLKKHHTPADIMTAANSALLLWFLPAVLSEWVAGRGPDKDEEWWKWAAKKEAIYPFQSMVLVRDVMNALLDRYGYQMSPAETAPESIVKWFRAVSKALEERDARRAVKQTAETLGYVYSLPLKQLIITSENLFDLFTDPNTEFYARDLLYIKPKDRQKR